MEKDFIDEFISSKDTRAYLHSIHHEFTDLEKATIVANHIMISYEKKVKWLNEFMDEISDDALKDRISKALFQIKRDRKYYRKSNTEFDLAVEQLLQNYNTSEINEEALADVSAQLFGNQEFINNIAQENPSIFKKIYSEIKYLWHQFRGYKNQQQFIDDLYYKCTQAYNSNNKLKEIIEMTYTVQLDFFIDEDVVRTDEEVKNVLEEIFDSCATSVSDIKVIDVND